MTVECAFQESIKMVELVKNLELAIEHYLDLYLVFNLYSAQVYDKASG